MRLRPAPGSGGRSAIAVLAALALWLQILVPAIGTTAHLVLSANHHAGHHAQVDYAHHDSAPVPSTPAQEHGGQHSEHLGLCCIIGGGKLGTGFAPPPSGHALPPIRIQITAFSHGPDQNGLPVAKRSVLPVGARAPPRFA